MSEALAAPYGHCDGLLRANDRDQWLCNLFAPADKRPHLAALHAFALEIAQVRDKVSNPMAGEIRLQWWRDGLAGQGRGEVTANPLAAALLDTISRFHLPTKAFVDLIDAREFDLYHDPMPDIAALESWCGGIFGATVRLACLILANGEDPGGAAAAGHAGMALGIASLLRDLARDSTGGRCYMPGDVLARHGLAVADVLERSPSPAVLAALAEMRGLARRHVAQARQGRGDAAAVIAPAFLSLALVEPVLRRMDRSGYDPFRTIINVPQWRLQWAIWRAARK